jgi:hypothetical protein
LYFDGALVAPPPACADTSNPKDKIAAAITMAAVLLYIEFSVGLRRSIRVFLTGLLFGLCGHYGPRS